MMTIINITGVEGTTAYRDDYTANCGACYQDKDGPVGPDGTFPENGGRAYCTVADTIGRSARTCPGASPTRTTTPSSTASASDRRRRRRRYRSRCRSR